MSMNKTTFTPGPVRERFFELGRKGANADINHPDRKEWESLRELLHRHYVAEHATTRWRYEEMHDGRESLGIRVYEGDDIVCNIYGCGCADFDRARLIAAAPELYEALQYAKVWIEEARNAGGALPCEQTLLKARAALAKTVQP